MGIYGWYAWTKGFKNNASLPISQLKVQNHLIIIVGGFILTYLVGTFFKHYTDAVATYLDAFTTVFSIITTVLVARKILENWLYWIIIDAVYIYLYGSRGGYLFAFLNVVYVIIAIIGYVNWRNQLKNNHDTTNRTDNLDAQALKD
jgi:nicotinamide mononucleotide transporter